MIKKSDSDRLAKHYPNVNWENLLWGFTCFSRQDYAGTVPLDAEDEILLGIQYPGGGCLCEVGISWQRMNNQLVPRLSAFSEAWHLLLTPTLQQVLDYLAHEKALVTPDEVSQLLLSCGFTDLSDIPLSDNVPEK